ncbi:MAG TPA: hypothetical protein VNJ71_02030 [Gemmatimonadales bacterium]|jgi:hypothetical protein|nr:hypothetical protein [Gemmatimonadales bacterium]
MVPRLRAASLSGLAALAVLGSCRGRPPGSEEQVVRRLVDSLQPAVERAAGLRFTTPPRAEVRSRDQVRAYLVHKLDQELPPAKARGLQAAYRLLGLLPDSIELRPLLLDLFTEQIVGYYEPDSTTLFVVAHANREVLRLTVAHELVHALQHQYLPLDSILEQGGDNDRLSAAQAVLEGQATLVGLQVIVPDQNLFAMPQFWETYRSQLRAQQAAMPVFSQAPRLIRESVLFPYLAGADFLRWWAGSEHRDTVPFGPRMPVSTEQILHPDRYGRGDVPVALRFKRDQPDVLYEDVMGEFDIRVLAADLVNAAEVTTPVPLGWGGDRFRVFGSPLGPALVWYLAFDDQLARLRFLTGTGQRLEKRRRLGYRMELIRVDLGPYPGVRIVLAPDGWAGWGKVVEAEVVSGPRASASGSLPRR